MCEGTFYKLLKMSHQCKRLLQDLAKCFRCLITSKNVQKLHFYYQPRTSGAGRAGAPSPSPLRFQPQWSRCGSSHVAWHALVSPSRSLYWHRKEDNHWLSVCFYNIQVNLCSRTCAILQHSRIAAHYQHFLIHYSVLFNEQHGAHIQYYNSTL